MDFLILQGKRSFPLIKELYNHFVNSDEYSTHPKLKAAERELDKVLDMIKTDMPKDSYGDYEDCLYSVASNYELVGFMFGFRYALDLQKELG